MMRRWLPHPVTSCVLLVAWLLLNRSADAGHVLLGALLAVAIPLAVRRFFHRPVRLRRPRAAVRLALVVLWDIVRANVNVARLVLGPPARLRPVFVEVPLDVEHPIAVALLASIVTMTPGTVSCDPSTDRRRILVHALDVDDPDRLAREIKSRYERPLQEIFAC
ncbi:MAG: Na+/H+ antiporter subunit E [Burkholderiales bacterium]|nr:Na+/H+ antiporter subunit E [Burkholderiales bacterium]